ncbi:hypothetical protein I3760_05G177800 [Carya illinoinensis]|nr:hypothetical protein I3760_05G177800 [Carya illinoinensis]
MSLLSPLPPGAESSLSPSQNSNPRSSGPQDGFPTTPASQRLNVQTMSSLSLLPSHPSFPKQ